MNLLQIIQTVCAELGLNQPSLVVGSTDLQTNQLYALANREGQSLYRDYDWTQLQTQFIVNVEAPVEVTGDVVTGSTTITNVDTTGLDTNYNVSGTGMPQAQLIAEILSPTSLRVEMEATATEAGATLTFARQIYQLPDDFDRYIGQTWWDRTNHWRLIGPDSPQMWQYLESGIFATGPRIRWRQRGRVPDALMLWPPPTAQSVPDALVWEYVSRNWVEKLDGTFANTMTADTDTPLLDPQAMILGIKWRYWQIKGMDYGSMQQEYIDYCNQLMARDGGNPDLFLNRRTGPFLIGTQNVQDGFWPGPGNN
jgi:acyl-CoA-binding protein